MKKKNEISKANATEALNVATTVNNNSADEASSNEAPKQIIFDCSEKINFTKGMKHCTPEWLERKISDPMVKQNCDLYKQKGDEKYKEELPVACFQAWFKDKHRCKSSAVQSGLIAVDIDDHDGTLGIDLNDYYDKVIEPAIKKDFGEVAMVYITPSGKGFRVVERVPLNADIETEHMKVYEGMFMKKWPLDSLDAKCFLAEQAFYLVPKENVLYYNKEKLFGEAMEENTIPNWESAQETSLVNQQSGCETTVANQGTGCETTVANHDTGLSQDLTRQNVGSASESPEQNVHPLPEVKPYDPDNLPILPLVKALISKDGTEYNGIPKIDIRDQLLKDLKLTGKQGLRNSTMLSFARHMACICTSEKEVLSYMPTEWGLPETEMKDVVHNACRYLTGHDPVTGAMTNVIRYLTLKQQETTPPPPLPKNLPKAWKTILAPYPDSRKSALAITCIPALGTLASNARFEYMNNEVHSIAFFSCLMAHSGMSKSSMNVLTQRLLKPLYDIDKETMRKMQDYNDELLVAGDGEKKKDPHFFLFNMLPKTSTSQMFTNQMNANGQMTHTLAPEIDDLRWGYGWANDKAIWRLGFDNDLGGQLTKTAIGTSAMVHIRNNVTMSGTPQAVKSYFKSNAVENGTVGRIAFVSYQTQLGDKWEFDKRRTERNEQELDQYIKMLRDEPKPEKPIFLKKLVESIVDWAEKKRMLYNATQIASIEQFKKRSAVMGFRAGCAAWILEGHKLTKAVIDFALWVAETVLYYQMKYFGEEMEQQSNENIVLLNNPVMPASVNIMKELPEKFTTNDYTNVLSAHGRKGSGGRVQVGRWLSNGWIQEVGKEGRLKVYQFTHDGIAMMEQVDQMIS